VVVVRCTIVALYYRLGKSPPPNALASGVAVRAPSILAFDHTAATHRRKKEKLRYLTGLVFQAAVVRGVLVSKADSAATDAGEPPDCKPAAAGPSVQTAAPLIVSIRNQHATTLQTGDNHRTAYPEAGMVLSRPRCSQIRGMCLVNLFPGRAAQSRWIG